MVLKFLRDTPLATKPIVLPAADGAASPAVEHDDESVAAFSAYAPWVMVDATAAVNYGCGVSEGALAEISHWASLSLAALDCAQVTLAPTLASTSP